MHDTATSAARGWRPIERYAYVERPYDDVWMWLAGHLSLLGDPMPDGGRAIEFRIRPAGKEVSRPVRLHVGGMVCGHDRARAGLRWADATHPHLFPQLAGTLEIAPVPSDGPPFTQLGIVARYRPPLGPLGAVGNLLVGADITDVSLTTWLDELADAVADHLVPPSLQPDPDPAVAAPPNYRDYGPDVRRVLVPVDQLAVRPGGATRACEALRAMPGIVHVTLNPFSGLAAVDHDPAVCSFDQVTAALEAAAGPADQP